MKKQGKQENLGKLGQVRTSWDKLGQVGTSLDKFGQGNKLKNGEKGRKTKKREKKFEW